MHGISPIGNIPYDFYSYYPLITPLLTFVYAIVRDFVVSLALRFCLGYQHAKLGRDSRSVMKCVWTSKYLHRCATKIVHWGIRNRQFPERPGIGLETAARMSKFNAQNKMLKDCSDILEMEKKEYRHIKIAHMKRLKQIYPRYKGIWKWLVLSVVVVFTGCHYVIWNVIDPMQKKLMQQVDLEPEADIYATINMICSLIDQNPELVGKRKRNTLARYVAAETGEFTDPDLARTWLRPEQQPLTCCQYIFDDLDVKLCGSTFLGDCLFNLGIKYTPLYDPEWLNDKDMQLRNFLRRNKI